MAEEAVAREVAEAEFERFAEAMDLDVDEESISDEDDRKGLRSARDAFVRAVMRGKLAVNEVGEPVVTLSTGEGEELTFYEPTFDVIAQSDKTKAGKDMAKMALIMGAMTKTSAAKFSKMRMRDFKVCQTVVTLFFG